MTKKYGLIIASVIVFCLVVFAFMGFPTVRGLSPLPEGIVSNMADWVFHIHVASLRETDIGENTLEALPFDLGSNLEEFKDFTGGRPWDTVDTITVYGSAENSLEFTAVIKGDFDQQNAAKYIGRKPGHEESDYRGHKVHSWLSQENGKMNHAAFAAPDTIIFSYSQAAIELGLDVYDGASADIDWGERFSRSSETPYDAFLVVAVKDIRKGINDYAGWDVLEEAESFFVHAAEREGILSVGAALKTTDAQAAEKLGQRVRGIFALTVLNPNMAGLRSMLQATEIKVESEMLIFNMDYPSMEFFSIIGDLR